MQPRCAALDLLHAYLPRECAEVHNVVHGAGALQVSAVHVHRVAELVAPRVGVDAQRVNVHVGQVHEAVHHPVELCNSTTNAMRPNVQLLCP